MVVRCCPADTRWYLGALEEKGAEKALILILIENAGFAGPNQGGHVLKASA
jgi:hypothetical protein